MAGIVMVGGASVCLGQNEKAPPMMTVTAGQGGYIVLPDTRPEPQGYALTGEVRQTRQSSRVWQHVAGPTIRVGQSEITLPASR